MRVVVIVLLVVLVISSTFNLLVELDLQNQIYELEVRLYALEKKDISSQCIQWWTGETDLLAARKRLCTVKK